MKKYLFVLGILVPVIICEWTCECGQNNADVLTWCDYCGKTRPS